MSFQVDPDTVEEIEMNLHPPNTPPVSINVHEQTRDALYASDSANEAYHMTTMSRCETLLTREEVEPSLS